LKIYTNEQIEKIIKRKNTIRFVIKCIVSPIVLAIVIINLYLFAQKIKNPNGVVSFMGFKAFAVTSGSMEPELKIGDMIITYHKNKDELVKGDIIAFDQGENIITHRIVDIKEENGIVKYITKGDNNNANDEILVDYSKIEGVSFIKVP